MEKHVELFGIMVLKWNIANKIASYAAGLVLLNIETFELQNEMQCNQ